ncbi:MAG: peptide ABC transporter substrate-binding protein [Chloroflexota bacterium]
MDCLATYNGEGAVQTDQMVVRFELLPGLLWSDGLPLSADDSVYSYEIAQSLYPQVRADLLLHTSAYQALDANTIEWRAVPGYRDPGFATNFFTPLPRHAWGNLAVQDLFSAEISTRKPLGWGAYVIEEWIAGDHITLSRNPNYFRQDQDIPRFDKFVFRFMPDKDQAKLALLAGECDLLDETVYFSPPDPQLVELESEGKAQIVMQAGVAWEHMDFDILPVVQPDENRNMLFHLRETRQAIAMCIDRQRLVDEFFRGKSLVPTSFVPPSHPLLNADVKQYAYDPGAASALLETAGWIDQDGDPHTPRQAQGVTGVTDGTALAFTFLTTTEPEKQQAAQIIQSSLEQCGIRMEINASDWQTVFAPGPDGAVFGRKFEMAQFGWEAALEPPCFLYMSSEIPGPYPEASKGWGGANASGYSNPEYDLACQQALATIAGMPEHQAAHFQAQAILAEDVPMIPLYLRTHTLVARSDLCHINLEAVAESALWNLEFFDYGQACNN